MAFQERDNSGALFRNERKEKENQPDYKGTAMINGVSMEIGAWVKEAKNGGKKYFSLSFQVKQVTGALQPSNSSGFNGAQRPQQNPPPDQYGEALPF